MTPPCGASRAGVASLPKIVDGSSSEQRPPAAHSGVTPAAEGDLAAVRNPQYSGATARVNGSSAQVVSIDKDPGGNDSVSSTQKPVHDRAAALRAGQSAGRRYTPWGYIAGPYR